LNEGDHRELEAYCDGQTCYLAYQKLEQCKQQPKERVAEFKVRLEELFWMLEDEPSELAITAKFMTGLLPTLNRKLRGKEYASFWLAVRAAQIEEQRLGETVEKARRKVAGTRRDFFIEEVKTKRTIMATITCKARAVKIKAWSQLLTLQLCSQKGF